MADIQDDSEDSRTLLAGRKRGFEEASQDQTAESEESHKRTRQDSSYEPESASNLEAAADSTSPIKPPHNLEAGIVPPAVEPASSLRAAPQVDVETAEPSAVPTSPHEPQASKTVAADVLGNDLSGTEEVSRSDHEVPGAAIPPPKPSWNNVQKGLRTSFASKKSRSNPVAVLSEIGNNISETETTLDQRDDTDMDENAEPSAGQSPDLSNNESSGIMDSTPNIEDREETLSEPKQRRRRGKKAKAVGEETAPIPFKRIKAKQLSELSPGERAAYKLAKRLHERNDPEKKRKRAERMERERQMKDAKDQGFAEASSVKHGLNSAQGKANTETQAIKAAKDQGIVEANSVKQDLNSAHEKAKANTETAANLLKEHGWPLPKTHKDTADLIYKGYTYYPRKYDRSCTYPKGGVEFVMTPTLGSDGLPIQFPDISFNEFAIKLLIVYSKDWPTLAEGSLGKAFAVYVNFFYTNHYSDDGPWRKRIKDMTLTENNAFTLAEAMAEATRRISSSTDSLQPQNTKNESKVHGSVNDDIIMIDDDESSESGEISRSSTSSDGEVINIDLNETQLLLQQKYYPSADGTTTATATCRACSQVGHDCGDCPALLCTSCGEKHSTFRCPDRQKCSKCRERGHTRDDCPEKLGVPKSELQCEFCSSKEHLEAECHMIWRSFYPKPEEIRTVRDIPIDCYSCGASNHFGPDCGLRAGRLLTGGLTWSRSNLERYVDPASQRRALSAGIDYSIPVKKGFSIKGKANDPITFDDSSDDGERFIRPKVQNAQRGHIRFGERQESKPVHGLPRRPASPIAPYRNRYEGGFVNGEESRYGMSSDRYYDEVPHNGYISLHSGAPNGGDRSRNNTKPPRRSENSGPRGRASKSGGPKGGRGRGRGR